MRLQVHLNEATHEKAERELGLLSTLRVLADESGDDFNNLLLLAAGELRHFFKDLMDLTCGPGLTGNISKGTAQIALPGFPHADGIIAELFHLAGKNRSYTDKQLADAVRKFPQYSKVADQALDPSLNIYDSRYQAPPDWTKANQGGYSAYFHYAQYNICFTAPANNGMKRLIR